VYKACTYAGRGDSARALGLLEGYFGEMLRDGDRAADAAMCRYYRWEPQRRLFARWGAKLAGAPTYNAPIPRRTIEAWELAELGAASDEAR
jgi:hypothetical protein